MSSFTEYKLIIFFIVYLAFFQSSFLLSCLVENYFSNFNQILSLLISLDTSLLYQFICFSCFCWLSAIFVCIRLKTLLNFFNISSTEVLLVFNIWFYVEDKKSNWRISISYLYWRKNGLILIEKVSLFFITNWANGYNLVQFFWSQSTNALK